MRRLLWVALLVALVSCRWEPSPPTNGSGLRPTQNLDAPGLKPLNKTERTQLIDERAGNCPVNELKIPGEGARAQGGIGGLAVSPYPLGTTPGDPLTTGDQIAKLASAPFTEPVAILVVDDFNGVGLRQPGVYFLDQRLGDTLADLPARLPPDVVTRAEQQTLELAALEASGQLSHGALVFNHTLALLRPLGFEMTFDRVRLDVPVAPFGLEPFDLILADFRDLGLTVAAVDTEDFDTEIIAGRVAATLQHLRGERGARHFAVNLSFGLVPCSVLEDFNASRDRLPTLEAYQEEVLNANGLDAAQFRDALSSLLTTPVGSDPLLTLVKRSGEQLIGGGEVTYLAAAGNYRLDYALYPGYWPEFVSVSAQEASSPTAVRDATYSNTGEVLLPGGFYALSAFDPASNTWRPYPQISVAGTSFAAPALSVFAALDYAHAPPRCARPPGVPTSPLAFFDTDPPVSTPLPALNVPLEDALSQHCS